MRRVGGWIVCAALAWLMVGLELRAQNPESGPSQPPTVKRDGDYLTVQFEEKGTNIDDFIIGVSNTTGKVLTYNPKQIQNRLIKVIGKRQVHKDNLFEFFQTLFITQDLALVPLGPPETEVYFVEDIKTSQFLKQRARFVKLEDLERYSRRVGEVISSTIPLKYIPVDKAQRALTNIVQDQRVGFVVPIEESNSLLVLNFAPTVWTMYQIIKAMDVPVAENQLNFEKLSLEYHVAEELGPIIESLMEVRTNIRSSGGGARGGPPGGQPSSSNEPPAPKIIPDPRNNALLVYAVEEYMKEIKMLVASLDEAVTEPNSNIHIYELKNTNAEDMQAVLADLLGGSTRRSTRATGQGGTNRAQQNTPGQNFQNQGGLGNQSNDPDAVNIVADPNTNSLLITATRARYEEIIEIIAKLDRRRPQVLVQAAVAELSDNDLENIGVELAAVEGGQDEGRFFGGTAFGLSTIENQASTGGGDGTEVTDRFFDDLVRVPNLDALGLTGGIFRDFVEVPILVQLFKRLDKGNLVSVPSILVNDNQEATIKVGSQIPTTNITQGQVSDQQSFGGYQEASLTLSISPHISNDDYLRLNVTISVQAFTGSQSSPSVPPPKTTRDINTAITVQSGKTVVIGGLTTDNVRSTTLGIPFLMDIPILGELFKSTSTTRDRTTLYVFITPTILKEFEALERLSYDRKLEISKLEGQIHLVDPEFRPLELDDKKLSIETIESTGHLDLPQYRPSVNIRDEGGAPTPNNTEGAPVKPQKSVPVENGSNGAGATEGAGEPKQNGAASGVRNPNDRPAPVTATAKDN